MRSATVQISLGSSVLFFNCNSKLRQSYRAFDRSNVQLSRRYFRFLHGNRYTTSSFSGRAQNYPRASLFEMREKKTPGALSRNQSQSSRNNRRTIFSLSATNGAAWARDRLPRIVGEQKVHYTIKGTYSVRGAYRGATVIRPVK